MVPAPGRRHGRPVIREVASVTVPTARGGYPVRIGTGLVDRLDQLLPAFPGAEAAAVVSCGPVAEVAGRAGQALGRRGLAVHQLEVPAGEEAKRLEVVAGLYERLAGIPTRRADPVVAVGGGATTDVAGFAAATWLRGVPLVNIPTTVLGMVDAAVGGKTGVDLARRQEPGRRLPPAGGGRGRPGHPGRPAGGRGPLRPGRGGQGRAGRRPRPGRGPGPRRRAGRGRRPGRARPPGRGGGPGQGGRRRRRRARGGRRRGGRTPDAELRAHPRAMPWSGWPGTGGSGTGRRWRWGWCSRPGWPRRSGWPGRAWPTATSSCWPPSACPSAGCASTPTRSWPPWPPTRSTARACAWSCSADLGQPEVVAAPDRQVLVAAIGSLAEDPA